MKKTSKILLVLALSMIITFACIIGVMQMNIAYAAEENEVIAEATETTAETPTFSGQVTKWFKDNIVSFLSTVNLGFIMSCVFFVIKAWKNNKNSTKLTVDNLSLNTESNNEVVKVVNKMIGSYNQSIEGMDELRKDYEEMKKKYDEVVAFSKATLDILSTVYANNKNLPQGVKDLVAIKYATALKSEIEIKEDNPSEE